MTRSEFLLTFLMARAQVQTTDLGATACVIDANDAFSIIEQTAMEEQGEEEVDTDAVGFPVGFVTDPEAYEDGDGVDPGFDDGDVEDLKKPKTEPKPARRKAVKQ